MYAIRSYYGARSPGAQDPELVDRGVDPGRAPAEELRELRQVRDRGVGELRAVVPGDAALDEHEGQAVRGSLGRATEPPWPERESEP